MQLSGRSIHLHRHLTRRQRLRQQMYHMVIARQHVFYRNTGNPTAVSRLTAALWVKQRAVEYHGVASIRLGFTA